MDDDLEEAIGSGRFISGIYNYCDLWCEQCRFSDRCLVYHQEQRTLERHRLAGEDPDDPGVFARDLEQALGQTLATLEKMAAQSGVTLDDAADEEPKEEPDSQNQPLYSWDADTDYRYTDVFPQFSKDRRLAISQLNNLATPEAAIAGPASFA